LDSVEKLVEAEVLEKLSTSYPEVKAQKNLSRYISYAVLGLVIIVFTSLLSFFVGLLFGSKQQQQQQSKAAGKKKVKKQ